MNHATVIVNITHPRDPDLQKKSLWFSEQPGITLLTSSPKSLAGAVEEPPYPILHITRKGIYLEAGDHPLHFHPSMALLRVMQIIRGEGDRFLEAVDLQAGDVFLDATFGLGTDALVAAAQVGAQGKVIGIEHSPILAALVKDGLKSLAQGEYPRVQNPDKVKAWQALAEAAQRIEVLWGNHLELLTGYPTAFADVVYFDPMFRHTREKSASIRPLHEVANSGSLQGETVVEACRVAKRRVVLKERKASREFSRLGFAIQEGGNYSHVDYGIIHKEGAGS
ncbi:class I SAM-dependent methyltransferase [Desulfitobacterium chlororespirans]|uniref:Putative SAM-dependent methyltransferase n=1 Tax=Desulfitobacterium chlororespirans DSM 11544 TaxID=1121395 RepID=A0A1M7UMH3_9FIRM|nr:class I SAM-dependent methyltransferase [Desulfitobacterium chlororespirans]SHN84150.1 Putative SAM-dependent methyltransferase [Desulfitobacterium chlororespirans DSM 11544]